MHEDLTVYQNLAFAALLKLPADMPKRQKLNIIEDVLQVLEIDHIRQSYVGQVGRGGISGGQRKRVNIGMELVGYPRLLFMDEPTTGLDSTSALHLARCLLRLRALGVTTICVIHQPRYTVFTTFATLLLLAPGGRTLYIGDTVNVQEYFVRLGFPFPVGENVADWMLDVAAGKNPRYTGEGRCDEHLSVEALVEEWQREILEPGRDVEAGLTQGEAQAALERIHHDPMQEKRTSSKRGSKRLSKVSGGTLPTQYSSAVPVMAARRSQLAPGRALTRANSATMPGSQTLERGRSSQFGACQSQNLDPNTVVEQSLRAALFDGDEETPSEELVITFEMLRSLLQDWNLPADEDAQRRLFLLLGGHKAGGTERRPLCHLTLDELLTRCSPKFRGVSGKLWKGDQHQARETIFDHEPSAVPTGLQARKTIGYFPQQWLLIKRCWLQFPYVIFCVAFIASLLIGAAFGSMSQPYDWQPSSFVAAVALSALFPQIIMSAVSMDLYYGDLIVFKREARSVNVVAYFLAKQICALPMLFAVAVAWAAGFGLGMGLDCSLGYTMLAFFLLCWYTWRGSGW